MAAAESGLCAASGWSADSGFNVGTGDAAAGDAAAGAAGATDFAAFAASSEPAAGAAFSVTGSASALPGVAAMTVLSLAIEVTAGDLMARGIVTADSLGPADGDGEGGLAAAGLAGSASAEAEGLLESPLSLSGEGLGLVGRAADKRVAEAAGGVEPDPDDLRDPDEDEADGFLSSGSATPVDFDVAPRAAATVKSEDSPLASGALPFLLSDSGLGSTLFRTTVSG